MSNYAYNPITGQLDLVGGGSSYIDGVVANSSLLPVTLGTPALDSVYLAKAGSGVWLINRRPAGLYCRVANNGNLNDWVALGAFPEINSSANWELYDGTDPTKELKFDLSGITSGTTRTLTAPNASGRIQVEGQAIGSTTPAAGAFTTLTANNGTLTGASAPVLDLAQTWNNAAVAFTGLRFNVTNTSSSAVSFYQEWQDGGVTQAAIRTGGFLYLRSGRIASPVGGGWAESAAFLYNAQSRINSTSLLIGSGGTGAGSLGVTLSTEGVEHVLALRNATAAQTFNIYNTFTSATNHERGFLKWNANVFQIGTEKGSGGGTARALEFQTDGVTRMTISDAGAISLATGLAFAFAGRVGLSPIAQGSLRILGTDGSTFNFLYLGLNNASYPALKRVGTGLQIRLGDDSADAPLSFSNATASGQINTPIIRSTGTWLDISDSASGPRFGFFSHGGLLLRDAGYFGWNASGTITSGSTGDLRLFRDAAAVLALRNDASAQTFRIYNTVSGTGNVNFDRVNFRWASNEFIIDAEAGGTGTLRGIKIGSATSSLLGFYGATPVDRPATVADPAGGGTVDAEARTAINNIIDRLQELGLIA